MDTRVRSGNNDRLDLNLGLWQTLLTLSSKQFSSAVQGANEVVQQGSARLLRLVEPPPTGFPPGPSGDQVVSLLSNPLQFLEELHAKHGDVVGLLLGGERVILIASPEAAKQVTVEEADVFIKAGTAFFPGSSLAGNGLLVSDGDIWRRQRRLSNPAFRRAAVDAYAGAMVEETQRMFAKNWAAGTSRDVYEDFNELTLRVTTEALFGASTSSRSANRIVACIEKAFAFFTRRASSGFIIPEWLPTWDNLEFGAAVSQLDRVVYGIISARRQELADQGPRSRADLLQGLLLSRDEDGTGMTDSAMRDELMTMLVAGQETSAILLGWASALLAHHPDIQQRAAQEVQDRLQGGSPCAADTRALPLVEAVVLEALRLYSPAYLIGRCACRDAQLSGYSVPKGTTVLVSPYLLHRDSRWWLDPERFDPDRWLRLAADSGLAGFTAVLRDLGPNGAYMPFGGGPRNCIGTGFAMMEAVLVLAMVLQRYRLQPLPGAPFPQAAPLITLRPTAVKLLLQPRPAGLAAEVHDPPREAQERILASRV